MKKVSSILIVLSCLLLPATAMSQDSTNGRYQIAVSTPRSDVFVLDTREGHLWIARVSEMSIILYLGQVKPGNKPGQIVSHGKLHMSPERFLDSEDREK